VQPPVERIDPVDRGRGANRGELERQQRERRRRRQDKVVVGVDDSREPVDELDAVADVRLEA